MKGGLYVRSANSNSAQGIDFFRGQPPNQEAHSDRGKMKDKYFSR